MIMLIDNVKKFEPTNNDKTNQKEFVYSQDHLEKAKQWNNDNIHRGI
jgi:hypothetical protein